MSTNFPRRFCIVKDCKSSDITENIILYEVPLDERRLKWLQAVKREDLHDEITKIYVCEQHFDPSFIHLNSSKYNKTLRKYAIPCRNLPENATQECGQPTTATNSVIEKPTSSQVYNPNVTIENISCTATETQGIQIKEELDVQIEQPEFLQAQTNLFDEKDNELHLDDDEFYIKIEETDYSNTENKIYIIPDIIDTSEHEPSQYQIETINPASPNSHMISSVIENEPPSIEVPPINNSEEDCFTGTLTHTIKNTSTPSYRQEFYRGQLSNITAVYRFGTGNQFLVDLKEENSGRLSKNLPRSQKKREKDKLLQLEKKDLVVETEEFSTLCRKYLSKDLSRLIKSQCYIQLYNAKNCTREHKVFCLHFYYKSPLAYQLLQKVLKLPDIREVIKNLQPKSTVLASNIMTSLKVKFDLMTEKEKYCSVTIGSVKLQANLFYDIKKDTVVGFQEINEVQSPKPARHAVIIKITGVFANWEQPMGYALMADCKICEELYLWINRLLLQLPQLGLRLLTLSFDLDCDFWDATNKVPNFNIFGNKQKTYYLFNPDDLMRSVRNYLVSHDFQFNESVVKWEYIFQFYEKDKNKTFKLAPKLTDRHMDPRVLEKAEASYAIDVLSNTVAAGISFYVDHNKMDKLARDTVKFLLMINTLYTALTSTCATVGDDVKKAFCGNESQIQFFRETKDLLESLKVIDKSTGQDVTSTVKFIKAFQTSITSVMSVFDEVKKDGIQYLCTRNLNNAPVNLFINDMKTKDGTTFTPTSRQFRIMFRKALVNKIVHTLPRPCHAEDLSAALDLADKYVKILIKKNEFVSIKPPPLTLHVTSLAPKVKTSDYNKHVIPHTHPVMHNCEFLLKKCLEVHNDCKSARDYAYFYYQKPLVRMYKRYLDYLRDNGKRLTVVPPDDFVQAIEAMEVKFRSMFEKDNIRGDILKSIYNSMSNITITLPCPCFPFIYLKKFYIRMRIYYAIKFHNKAFRTVYK